MHVTVTWTNRNPNTIWNRLAVRLGRAPTAAEATAPSRKLAAASTAWVACSWVRFP